MNERNVARGAPEAAPTRRSANAATTGGRGSSRGEGLDVRGLSVTLGGADVLVDLDLSVGRGEIVALLGPSGCGKTTLLRAVAGLQAPDAGSVHWAGEDLCGVATHRRRFGMVFQDHALLPHRNVGANVAFGLRMQGIPAAERHHRVNEVLEMVGLAGYERRGVATLSGGEAQRVALARALAPEPRLLLADEPFAALDRPLHDRLVGDVRRILAALGQTAVHVTHDHAEAFAIADRVALMREGQIHRTATPQQLRSDPRDAWTAAFLGLGTVWRPDERGARRDSSAGIATPWGQLRIDESVTAASLAGDICLLIRPEAVRPGGSSGTSAIVSDLRLAGDRTVVTFDVPGAPSLAGYGSARLAVGQRCRITLDPSGVSLLTAELHAQE